jgi:hypothetical protein
MRSLGKPVKRSWIKKDFIFRIIEIRPDTGGDMENFAEKERNLYAYIRKICRMNREFS